jgi:LacI family transcriptional regulator
VPDDVSIVGSDDISLASLVSPRPTIRQPIQQMAARAVGAIIGTNPASN